MAFDRDEFVQERRPASGGAAFWLVLILICTLAGLIVANGGLKFFHFHTTSHFEVEAPNA